MIHLKLYEEFKARSLTHGEENRFYVERDISTVSL